MTETFINKSTLQENYSTLPNKLINDEKLSGDGLAVLVYLLSKPADWKVNAQNIANRFGYGINKVYSIIKQLIQYGYVKKDVMRDQGKYTQIVYHVYDQPFHCLPQMDLPLMDISETFKVKKVLNKESTNEQQQEINNSFTTAISFFQPLGLSNEGARKLFGVLRKHCNQFFEGQTLEEKDEFIFRALKDVNLSTISGRPQAYLKSVITNSYKEKTVPVTVYPATTYQMSVDDVLTAGPAFQDKINRDSDKINQVIAMIKTNQIHREQIRWFNGA